MNICNTYSLKKVDLLHVETVEPYISAASFFSLAAKIRPQRRSLRSLELEPPVASYVGTDDPVAWDMVTVA